MSSQQSESNDPQGAADDGAQDVVGKIAAIPREWMVRVACYAGVASMLTMAWSIVDPRPLPVMLASTLGPAGAALAFLLYLGAMLIPRKE